MRRKTFTTEQEQLVIHEYQQGSSYATLARLHGCNDGTIRLTLLRNNCKPRDLRSACRRLVLNTAAFDTLTPASAYWIGFLLADGHITDRTVHIMLDVIDHNHLEKFKQFLSVGHQVKDIERRYIDRPGVRINSCIAIGSRDLVQALEKFGFTTNKTFTASAPDSMLNDRHFWRGVIDGDGHVCRDSKGYPRMGLCGSKQLVTQFLAFVNTISFTFASVRPLGTIFHMSLSAGPAVAVIRELYRDCEYFLDRKALTAANMLALVKAA